MRAGKAYISSLGTTGLLVASSFVMLIVVGALVAFDRWPSQAVAESVTVPVAPDAPDAVRRTGAPGARSAQRDAVRAATAAGSEAALTAGSDGAARAGRRAAATSADRAPADDPIVSELPAPDAVPADPAIQAQAPASAPIDGAAPGPAGAADGSVPGIALPPTTIEPVGGDGLTEPTTELGGTADYLSPELGSAVRGTGSATDDALDALLGG